MFETMASFMLVEHANGAMFDPRWGPRSTRGRLRPIAGRCRSRLGVKPIPLLIYNDRHWSAFVNAVQPPWASDLGADAAQGLA
jgi:hypothetical protein